MKISAGVAIVLNKEKVLLCHPTNASWETNFSFPKGHVDEGEEIIDAAIRELREETSVIVTKSQIVNKDNPIIIDYLNNKGNSIYKRIYLFKVNINSLSEVGLTNEVLSQDKLQIAEVDWAGFLNKEDAFQKVFWKCRKHMKELWN